MTKQLLSSYSAVYAAVIIPVPALFVREVQNIKKEGFEFSAVPLGKKCLGCVCVCEGRVTLWKGVCVWLCQASCAKNQSR